MPHLTRNVLLRTYAILTIVFAVLWVTLPIEWMRLLGAVMMTTLMAISAAAWAPDAWHQMRMGRIETDRVHLIAIAGILLVSSLLGLYSLVFNIAGRPAWMSELPIWVWLQFNLSSCAFLLNSDPSRPTVSFSDRNPWVMLAIGCVVGAVIALIYSNIIRPDMF